MINLPENEPNILVVGDLMIDHYLWGSCERISPEAPVQVVDIYKENTLLGGAGNVINNLNSLGARVDVMSVIGGCNVSKVLKKLLKKINVKTDFLITQKDRITSKKSRIIAAQQQVIRFDQESTEEISSQSEDTILENFKLIISDYDIVLISDYGKGVLTYRLTQALISIASKNKKKVLVDPKGNDFSKYTGAFLLTPNKKEASDATNLKITDDKSLSKVIQNLKEEFRLDVSIITLSELGVAIYDTKLRIHPTAAREVFDVTGAGDTILASLGYSLSCNEDIDQAVKFANLAAGIVVGKIGSAAVTLDEIIQYESSLNKSTSNYHIKNAKEISSLVYDLKNNNQKIVFTNGCFDILHLGHIKYLEKAKSYGDKLIVGLNSDKSIKRIKGDSRPINSQEDRAYILASLEVVDFVVIFEEDTPLNLIKKIKPDLLVKGGDYKGKKIVGQDIVKEFKLIKFIDGKSTSDTIKRINNL